MLSSQIIRVLLLCLSLIIAVAGFIDDGPGKLSASQQRTVCTISPNVTGGDDSETIIQAFEKCKSNSHVIFTNGTYHIEKPMVTTGLTNVHVDMNGYLLWGTNISYWVNNSLPLNHLNMTCAWIFGGEDITFDGHNVGTFDGNGQLWYDFAKGVSNVPGRPINFVVQATTNSVFQNLRFIQSQFWTMAINSTSNSLFQNIYINSTSFDKQPARNTDGVDTFFSDNLTFRNFTVANGDDCISFKTNSTNMLIQDSTFYRGLGVAIGSIGQFPGVFERVENVTAERITCFGCRYTGYVKTWTGVQQGFPPNGGGGGIGYAKNITFKDFVLFNNTNTPAQITQCTSFSGATGGCDTSTFQLSDIRWLNMTGTINVDGLASLQCSAAAPCTGIDIELSGVVVNGTVGTYKCSNVEDPIGFTC